MYIKVKVTPKAKKESFKEEKGVFHIHVREIAERNLANRRVMEMVAAHFAVPQREVKIVSGHRSPSKIISVTTP